MTCRTVSDFLPSAPLPNLRRRAELLRQLRRFFHEQGFWEVETPLLSADTVVDRHLDPIPVACPTGSDSRETYWLQTSPEFAMKRLLAAGADAIFQVTRAFRHGELGALHNPEFTMVEWYRVGDDLRAGIQRLSDLAETLLGHGPAELRSYQSAFDAHLGINPHRASAETLKSVARQTGVSIPDSMNGKANPPDRDSWLQLLMAEVIQPRLGVDRPLVLFDYPASQAALAHVRGGATPIAERFELFFKGIELANGYHELTDANRLITRQRQENELRRRDGKPQLPEQNRLLDAMRAGLPACAGVALGFDRLVMVALGASSLADVIAFPFPRA